MGSISNKTIKKIVSGESKSGVMISGKAADAIAKLLEEKARKIAEYAVRRAKSKNRDTVTEEDVDTYRVMFGD